VLDLVGSTLLVRLDRATPQTGATVWGKAEHTNPGGSLKDRIERSLIEAAQAEGAIEPGDLLVEASSGNTAIALARAAAVEGYELVIAIPEKMSDEKVRLVRAFGAEAIVTSSAEPGDPEHYIEVAKRIADERDGYHLDQFSNPANARAHEHATGPEITEAFPDGPDALVAGAGTGGTITGIARALGNGDRETTIVCADPEGSVIHGGEPDSYRVEGIGDDFVPEGLDTELVDRYEGVTDRESLAWARVLAEDEGVLVGGSSGSTVAAARRVARKLPEGADVVAVLGDTGRNYTDKCFHDAWLRVEGLHAVLVETATASADRAAPVVGGEPR